MNQLFSVDDVDFQAKAATEKATGAMIRTVEKVTMSDNSDMYDAATGKNSKKSEVLVSPAESPAKEDQPASGRLTENAAATASGWPVGLEGALAPARQARALSMAR